VALKVVLNLPVLVFCYPAEMYRLSRRLATSSRYSIQAAVAAGAGAAMFTPRANASSDSSKPVVPPSSAAPAAAGHYVPQPIKCEDGTYVIPWATPSREEQLRRLKSEEFDVVVIGGGCVGAGVAWEAATRGLKVAMVERDDFASGTSGRSTKLIHGGIRYLEAAVFNLDMEMLEMVQEALSERAHLLNAAPYMAHPLPTIIPIYRWWEVPYMWAGAKAYDLVAGKERRVLPASYFIDRNEALFQFPMLKADGLKGAVVYYDGMHNDTRMNLMIALTACQHGAAVGNYVETLQVNHDGKTGAANGVRVKDVLSGEEWDIKAKGKYGVEERQCVCKDNCYYHQLFRLPFSFYRRDQRYRLFRRCYPQDG
jgi:FAD dependent oxidoreductase